MDPLWIINLPSILLAKLRKNEMLGHYYDNVTPNMYNCMMSRLLLTAFNENITSKDIDHIHEIHKRLKLTSIHIEEWMKCFRESLNEAGIESGIQDMLIKKIGAIGECIICNRYSDSITTEVNALIDEVLADECPNKKMLVERLKHIHDHMR